MAAGISFGLLLPLILGSDTAHEQSPSALAIGQRGEQTAVRREGQRDLDRGVDLYPAGRRARASERLDDDHTAAAAWAWIRVERIGLARVIGEHRLDWTARPA